MNLVCAMHRSLWEKVRAAVYKRHCRRGQKILRWTESWKRAKRSCSASGGEKLSMLEVLR